MKDDKFKLFIFSMIIIFVVFGIFVALSCSVSKRSFELSANKNCSSRHFNFLPLSFEENKA